MRLFLICSYVNSPSDSDESRASVSASLMPCVLLHLPPDAVVNAAPSSPLTDVDVSEPSHWSLLAVITHFRNVPNSCVQPVLHMALTAARTANVRSRLFCACASTVVTGTLSQHPHGMVPCRCAVGALVQVQDPH